MILPRSLGHPSSRSWLSRKVRYGFPFMGEPQVRPVIVWIFPQALSNLTPAHLVDWRDCGSKALWLGWCHSSAAGFLVLLQKMLFQYLYSLSLGVLTETPSKVPGSFTYPPKTSPKFWSWSPSPSLTHSFDSSCSYSTCPSTPTLSILFPFPRKIHESLSSFLDTYPLRVCGL